MASSALFLFVLQHPEVQIDEEDLNNLGMYQVHFSTKGYVRISYKGKLEYLHRVIMGLPTGIVDHKDRNKLNCRRLNLRVVTPAESSDNISSHHDSSSNFLGVYWVKERSKWCAQIMVRGVRKHLGYFVSEERAKASYEFNRKLFRG